MIFVTQHSVLVVGGVRVQYYCLQGGRLSSTIMGSSQSPKRDVSSSAVNAENCSLDQENSWLPPPSEASSISPSQEEATPALYSNVVLVGLYLLKTIVREKQTGYDRKACPFTNKLHNLV
ncbi:hypothetical protein M378DRAFT_173656 [Amanita muscaria Koide BX008]|uniref:Uncharacterized protein n=1 Tax=Amanita muscaria (strain Koide BX008) TaxID=946122 RepID=A0A0C2SN44_AMAMK|nr:hypothetical protein M378DRAFT_173656 [Amanita muscaria Koide BX008]